jgi:hypothetical protein
VRRAGRLCGGGRLRSSIDVDGVFENNSLIITLALALRLFTVFARRPLLSTLDSALPTC